MCIICACMCMSSLLTLHKISHGQGEETMAPCEYWTFGWNSDHNLYAGLIRQPNPIQLIRPFPDLFHFSFSFASLCILQDHDCPQMKYPSNHNSANWLATRSLNRLLNLLARINHGMPFQNMVKDFSGGAPWVVPDLLPQLLSLIALSGRLRTFFLWADKLVSR